MAKQLASHDVEQLLIVRSMLNEARQYAATVTHLRRVTAMVLLDGVVERVTHLVAVTRGIDVKRDGLPELIGKVSTDLGAAWKHQGDAEVRQLHRARNGAQHEGVASDQKDIARWALGVNAYVRSLVEAQFGADLDQVSLLTLVNDPALRGILESAEQAMDDGDPGSCQTLCADAVNSAQRKWSSLHSPPSRLGLDAWRRMVGAPTFGRSDEHVKALGDDLADVHRLIDLTVFANDTAEARWFLAIGREPRDVLDADDARRALAFATNWVIGFEEAAASWVPDRVARSERARRLVRQSPQEPARVAEVVSVTPQSANVLNVVVRIAGVPEDAWFFPWSLTVTRQIDDARASADYFAWCLEDDGTAHVAVGAKVDVAKAVKSLKSALAEADRELAGMIATELARAARNRQSVVDFEAMVAAGKPLPDWVRSARVDPENVATELTLDHDLCHIGWGSAGQVIKQLLAGDPDVVRCYSSSTDDIVTFSPDLDARSLKGVLDRIDTAVRTELDQIGAERKVAETAANKVRADLEVTISERSM